MDSLLDYLCRFTVRAAFFGFSWKFFWMTITSPEGSVYYPPLNMRFNVLFRQYAHPIELRPLFNESRYWNFDQLSIDYPLWVRLRPRLTLIRLALIRKP